MYDAIIVGARCAGSGTALLLARKGYRVLLVDRARFPSDVPHGHMIHKDGPQRLRNWGLLDRLIEAGTPPLQTVSSYFGDFFLVAHDVVSDGIAWGTGRAGGSSTRSCSMRRWKRERSSARASASTR